MFSNKLHRQTKEMFERNFPCNLITVFIYKAKNEEKSLYFSKLSYECHYVYKI